MGLDGVFAAGDATAFPIKQGGLAAQQADAVAEMIAASCDISGEAGDDSTISSTTLWSPPDKIAGRYLAPYLSSQVGDAADVMSQHEDAIPVDAPLNDPALGTEGALGELSDLARR